MKRGYPDRFFDDGRHLLAYADEVWVRCAHCQAPGKIEAKQVPYRWNARFLCSICGLKAELSCTSACWFGPVVLRGQRPCGYCGYQWLYLSRVFDSRSQVPQNQFEVECPECRRISAVEGCIQQYMPGDKCIDPHFGMALYLKHEGRLGTLWAYNPHHLTVLRSYVSARLRTRNGAGNSSMFSRLPVWIKQAKNRQEVLKYLARLEVLASDIQGNVVMTH